MRYFFTLYIAGTSIQIIADEKKHANFIKKLYLVSVNYGKSKYKIEFTKAEKNKFSFKAENRKIQFYYPKRFSQKQFDLMIKIAVQLLFFKDVLMIHASSLVVDGKAYVFSGKSGEGKSTIAKQGSHVLSDELAVIKKKKGFFYVYPSVFDKNRASIRYDKAYPLRAIYFIKKSDDNFFEAIDQSEAFNLILKNSYINYIYNTQNETLSEKKKTSVKNSVVNIKNKNAFFLLFALTKAIKIKRLHFALNFNFMKDLDT